MKQKKAYRPKLAKKYNPANIGVDDFVSGKLGHGRVQRIVRGMALVQWGNGSFTWVPLPELKPSV